ncbi:hypothetical protein B0H11DRAFT_2279170, partial [Mycena galericulata]
MQRFEIRAVNRLFHGVSTPLLFRTFQFHPYTISRLSQLVGYDPTSTSEATRALERLDFWSSSSIAPLVLKCHISPSSNPGALMRSTVQLGPPLFNNFVAPGPPPAEDSLSILVDAFFKALHHFTRLRAFSAEKIHFTEIALEQLCLLSNLEDIRIDKCRMGGLTDASVKLGISTFSFWNNSGEVEAWIRALRPEALRTLSLQCSEIKALEYSFPHVASFNAGLEVSTLWEDLPALAKFPGVQKLARISFFVSSTPPGLHWPACISTTAIHFMSELAAVSDALNRVTYLSVGFEDYVENLAGLGELFPSLTSLIIWISTGESDGSDDFEWEDLEKLDKQTLFLFYEHLTNFPTLPVNLQHLEVCWTDSVQPPFEFSSDAVIRPNDLRKLKDTLLQRHSDLVTLRLFAVDYILFWWRDLQDGNEIFEVRQVDDSEISLLSHKFPSPWYIVDLFLMCTERWRLCFSTTEKSE